MNDNFIPTTLERGAALARLLSRIDGSTVYLRLAEISDSRRILDWRLNPELSRYLSPTEDSLEKQTDYMRAYKRREAEGKEFYYIICRRDNDAPAGCIRMHDIGETSAGWGNWIISGDRTATTPIESIMIIFTIGFLGFGVDEFAFFARTENTRACCFYARIGARQTGESTRAGVSASIPEKHFCFDRAAYQAAMNKHGDLISPAVDAIKKVLNADTALGGG